MIMESPEQWMKNSEQELEDARSRRGLGAEKLEMLEQYGPEMIRIKSRIDQIDRELELQESKLQRIHEEKSLTEMEHESSVDLKMIKILRKQLRSPELEATNRTAILERLTELENKISSLPTTKQIEMDQTTNDVELREERESLAAEYQTIAAEVESKYGVNPEQMLTKPIE